MENKSYIVRVYNQPVASNVGNRSKNMVGIIEDVDTGTKHAFHNKDELWKFMTEDKEQVLE